MPPYISLGYTMQRTPHIIAEDWGFLSISICRAKIIILGVIHRLFFFRSYEIRMQTRYFQLDPILFYRKFPLHGELWWKLNLLGAIPTLLWNLHKQYAIRNSCEKKEEEKKQSAIFPRNASVPESDARNVQRASTSRKAVFRSGISRGSSHGRGIYETECPCLLGQLLRDIIRKEVGDRGVQREIEGTVWGV